MTTAVREDVALGLCAALTFNFSAAVGERLPIVREHVFTPSDILTLRFDPGQVGTATWPDGPRVAEANPTLPETTKIYAEVHCARS